jgi:DNA polymerase-3 subunit beta
VTDKKPAMPALGTLLFTATADALRVAATDLYLAISGTTPAEVTEPGSVALPAKDLFERVRAMPEGILQLSATPDGHAVLKTLSSPRRYTLNGIPAVDFPQIPVPSAGAPSLTLPPDVLATLIARTHFSVSSDETRPHVNSGLLECAGETVRLVSTDGHRLSKMTIHVPGGSASTTMLIPLKALNELRRLADDARAESSPTPVTITQSGPSAFFSVANMLFSVKLVDAQFPPYDQVIPASSNSLLRASRQAFTDALRAISLAASDRTGGIKLTVTEGTLRITSESPESGNAYDEVPVDYAGPEFTIGFNAKYFLDVLGVLDCEEVLLGLTGELDPAVLRPADEPAGQAYVAVVMPMRI